MTARLRELAERWKRRRPTEGDNESNANELLSILDAEGDGGAETAPEIFHGTHAALSSLSIQPKDEQS